MKNSNLKELCDKWLANKNVNPETMRKITTTGAIYKKLSKKCSLNPNPNSNPNPNIKITQNEICNKWLANKNVNPETMRKITETGAIYKKLEKKAKIGHIPFIFLTAKGMTEYRIRGYKIGCKAYLAKPFDPEELVAVIDNILSDKKNIKNINNIKKEIQDLRKEINSFNKFNQNLTFTKREINILLAISQGLSNRDIANKLKISVRNVEKYVTRLLDKTNVCNRVKLANYKYLYKNGE